MCSAKKEQTFIRLSEEVVYSLYYPLEITNAILLVSRTFQKTSKQTPEDQDKFPI